MPAEDLFGENIKVHRQLIVAVTGIERRHVRDDDLTGSVDFLPGGEDQVRVPVSDFARPGTLLVPGLGGDSQISESLVDQAVREVIFRICADESSNPAITMSGMGSVHVRDQRDGISKLVRTQRILLKEMKVLVITGPADRHQLAEILYRVLSGELSDDVELLASKCCIWIRPSGIVRAM